MDDFEKLMPVEIANEYIKVALQQDIKDGLFVSVFKSYLESHVNAISLSSFRTYCLSYKIYEISLNVQE